MYEKEDKRLSARNPYILNQSDQLVDLTSTIAEVRAKSPEGDATIVDINAAANKKLWEDIRAFIDDEKKRYEDIYFVSILEVKDIVYKKHTDFKMFSQDSCPIPVYRQTVYKCSAKTRDIEFLWVVPRREKARWYRKHWREVSPNKYELLKYVMQFYDGTLDRLSIQINKDLGVDNG